MSQEHLLALQALLIRTRKYTAMFDFFDGGCINDLMNMEYIDFCGGGFVKITQTGQDAFEHILGAS